MATANVLSKQIYKEAELVTTLAQGISSQGRRLVEFKLSRLIMNENLIAEDKFRSLDEMARAYHQRSALLAEIYDIMRIFAH